MTHTPVPWFAVYNDVYWSINVTDHRYGQSLASTQENNFIPIDAETEKANAEFIVRACNSHEYLVAALKNTQKALEEIGYKHTGVWVINQMALDKLNEVQS